MILAVPALVLGALAGLLLGGKISNLGTARMRALPLLVAGAVAQALGQVVFENYPLVLLSFVLMLGFTLANARTLGFALAAVGIVCNIVVVGLNDGMPVRRSTLEYLGATDNQIDTYDFAAKRHLERPDDKLTFLGDVIPVPPVEGAVSIGDVLLVLGVAIAIAQLMREYPQSEPNEPEPL